MDKETLCGKTFETASGYIVTCHLKKGHEGQCRGIILNSMAVFDSAFSSEEEMIKALTPEPTICLWTPESEYVCCYTTGCKNDFNFFESSPADNHFIFCPFCGKKIKEKEFIECLE